MRKITSFLVSCALVAGLLVFPAEAHDMGKVGECQTVSMGSTHTAAIKSDGSLWVWGRNFEGQVGNGGSVDTDGLLYQSSPVKVLDNVFSVSCGEYHTAAVREDGSLWVWGSNECGQIGNGGGNASYNDKPIQTTPVKVLDDVAAVSCGGDCTAAIKTDGTLWVWGGNNGFAPGKIMDGVAAVSCGGSLYSVIKKDGTLWVWGTMYKEDYSAYIGISVKYTDAVMIDSDVASVSCGGESLAYIKNDGTVWTWGSNSCGQRGDGTSESFPPLTANTRPVQVKSLSNAVSISHGKSFGYIAAILADGSLWMWGWNNYGQLGIGRTGNDQYLGDPIQTIPVKVMDQAASVFCGAYSTAAIKSDGTLWTWGDNAWDMLGYQDYDRRYTISTPWGSATWGAKTTPKQVEGFAVKPSGSASAVTTPTVPTVGGFTDVRADDYFADAVLWAVDKGVTVGTGGNQFSPKTTCTDIQILTMLWRAAGRPSAAQAPITAQPYSDDFQGAINWAYEKGMIGGSFDPDTPCTRASTVTYIWRAFGSESAKASSFPDVSADEDYAAAVNWAVANGITAGTDGGKFSPDMICTREQIVTFLRRAYVPEARLPVA